MPRRKKTPRRRPARRGRPARQHPWCRRLLALALLLAAALLGYTLYLDHLVRAQFEGKRWSLPARVFARPLELYPGARLTADELERELRLLGYRPASTAERPGSYRRSGETLQVATRGFQFAEDLEPARRLRLHFDGAVLRRLESVGGAGAPALVRLEPLLIANIYPRHHEDRLLVRLEDVPPLLVQGLVAVEDRRYYEHHGVDPRAIARALLANLRAGATVQGGSTLTQQLVKNFFLSNERSLWRKFNEAIMALLLELHYDKSEILEAYLNEIYLGQDGGRAIHGMGLASHFYFRRPLEELNTEELALLVALVRGASYYDPRRHPERARARRDLVLDILASAGLIGSAEAARAKSRPLGVTPKPPSGLTPFPAYLGLVRQQLSRDYRDEDLRSEGLFIFTSFDPLVQLAAEQAVQRHLPRLATAGGGEGLQAAVVVATAEQGEVLALVGDRNPRYAGFNRALQARRPVGSLVKPAVYLTALARPRDYTLATLVEDTPLEVDQPGSAPWRPQNYDHQGHGRVMLLDALVHSYNLATARVGLAVGIPAVIRTLRALGVQGELNPYPSLLLGAAGLSPLEVTQMYQTLAAGGYRAPLRAIREVKDRQGRTLQRYPLEVSRAAGAAPVYLVDAALHEVTRRGTARALASLLPEDLAVAGKTGTTDDLRDSWFAGFSGEHVAVVWLGRDDNAPIGLSGAAGALPVWADLMQRLHTTAFQPVQPDDVEWALIDPATGLLGEGCPETRWVPFIAGSLPEAHAPCSSGAGGALKRTFKWFQELFH